MSKRVWKVYDGASARRIIFVEANSAQEALRLARIHPRFPEGAELQAIDAGAQLSPEPHGGVGRGSKNSVKR